MTRVRTRSTRGLFQGGEARKERREKPWGLVGEAMRGGSPDKFKKMGQMGKKRGNPRRHRRGGGGKVDLKRGRFHPLAPVRWGKKKKRSN